MRYWPEPSVTAVRAFSISAGLEASTVTPGSTAPDASLTTPVMDACANAVAGRKTKKPMATHLDRQSAHEISLRTCIREVRIVWRRLQRCPVKKRSNLGTVLNATIQSARSNLRCTRARGTAMIWDHPDAPM